MSIALEVVYKPSDDVVAREIEGEIIIVPLVAGIGDLEDEQFTLNDTGKAIWDQLDGQRSLADVVTAIETELRPPIFAQRDSLLPSSTWPTG